MEELLNLPEDSRGYYLGVDPGHTTGWCLVTEDGLPVFNHQTVGNIETSEFLKYLTECDLPLNRIIVEDYKILAKRAKSHIGSKVPAAQVIGIIEHQSVLWDVPLTKQPASILPMAERLVGVKMSDFGGHSKTHWVSAYLHAGYWLVSQDLMLSAGEKASRRAN